MVEFMSNQTEENLFEFVSISCEDDHGFSPKVNTPKAISTTNCRFLNHLRPDLKNQLLIISKFPLNHIVPNTPVSFTLNIKVWV